MTPNEVLLDVNVFPDYGQILIEDLGTREVPDGWSDDDVGSGGVVPVRASVIG